jgi:hypothetical protein
MQKFVRELYYCTVKSGDTILCSKTPILIHFSRSDLKNLKLRADPCFGLN